MVSDIETETGSLLKNLTCPECGAIHDAAVINTVCKKCASTLFATYEFAGGFDKSTLLSRPANMWRYKEFLPVTDDKNIVTLGEGFTPIIPIENLKQLITGNDVFWK